MMLAVESMRYGQGAVRRALFRFLGGKALSSVVGVGTLLLVMRTLVPMEFGAYSVLIGLVELTAGLSGLGLPQVLLRYVPDLHARHKDIELRRLILRVLSVRLVSLCVFAGTLFLAARHVAIFLSLEQFVPALQFFLLIVIVRVALQQLFSVLEALFEQGWAQGIYLLVTTAKFGAVALVILTGELKLDLLLRIELGVELAGLTLFCAVTLQVIQRNASAERASGSRNDDGGFLDARSRIISYAASSYFQHLAILGYGTSPNRLFASRLGDVGMVAAFGAAQGLADVARRYLPIQLLTGLIRPALIARYLAEGNATGVAKTAVQLLRLNQMLLAVPLVIVLVSGDVLLEWLSGGSYGSAAAYALAGLLVVLMLESQRVVLSLVCQVTEDMRGLVSSNMLLSLSILTVPVLFPYLSLLSLPAANTLGLVAANLFVLRALGRRGHHVMGSWHVFLRVCAPVVVGVIVGKIVIAQVQFHPAAICASLLASSVTALATGAVQKSDWYAVRALLRKRKQG